MKQIYLTTLLVLFISWNSNGQKNKNFKNYKLENGLSIILDRDASQKHVVGIVAANVGAQDEEENATGLAHYLEHMLFKGTETLGTSDWSKEKPLIDKIYNLYDELQKAETDEQITKINEKIDSVSQEASKYAIPNEFSKLVEQMGGVGLNASTNLDVTEYHNIFPPNQLERWLDLYAHRFEKPVFRLFQTELEAVYEEKNKSEDSPSYAYYRALQKNMYKGHPYSRPVIGYTDHLKRPNISKMKEFFEKWYVPSNMVLILSGNFDLTLAEKLINEKFGKWVAKNTPKRTVQKIKKFKGKNKVKVKLTRFLKGALAYNATPESPKEEIASEIASELLNNTAETGLLNKLRLDGDVMYAQAGISRLKGGSIFSIDFAPVFDINQRRQLSFKSAEKLIAEQVSKLKKGEYEDWLLEQVKTNMANQYDLMLENPMSRARALLNTFVYGKEPQSIFEYKAQLASCDKKTISETVNKYITDNYLALYSYKGSAKKEKIKKPKLTPIKPLKHQPSEYAQHFSTLPKGVITEKFVDFDKDVVTTNFQDKIELHYVPNKRNDVFSMEIKFKAGTEEIKLLNYAIQLMNNAGVMAQYKPDELKKEFGKLGITYSFFANRHNTFISMQGNEKNLGQACQLLSRLMLLPKIEEKALNRIIGNEYQARIFGKEMQGIQKAALQEYILYKNKSKFIDRIAIQDLISISPSDLSGKLNAALSYNADIFYYGKKNISDVKNILNKNLAFGANRKQAQTPKQKTIEKYKDNTIFLFNSPKSSQSKIFVFIEGSQVNKEEYPYISAFNQYFSGGFTGLMLKEIREYKSLAYTAGAHISTPSYPKWNNDFYASIGTQGDKTSEAVETVIKLIQDMPQYPERTSNLKDFMINSSLMNRPSDRNIAFYINSLKEQGYTTDPTKKSREVYQKLEFEDVLNIYQKYLKGKPYVIGIVGPAKNIDIDKLKKFGKVIKVKAKQLFSKK